MVGWKGYSILAIPRRPQQYVAQFPIAPFQPWATAHSTPHLAAQHLHLWKCGSIMRSNLFENSLRLAKTQKQLGCHAQKKGTSEFQTSKKWMISTTRLERIYAHSSLFCHFLPSSTSSSSSSPSSVLTFNFQQVVSKQIHGVPLSPA